MSLNTSGNLTSSDMFDYSKGEASALGFEPLEAQSEKPEINVMKLSDYTQVQAAGSAPIAKSEETLSSQADEEEPTPAFAQTEELGSAQSKRVVTFSSRVRWKTSQNSLRNLISRHAYFFLLFFSKRE